MNGTGIVNHDVFLPGAEAGKTYFYRMQGSTAGGALYQSPVQTFALEGDAVTAPGGSRLPTGVGTNVAPSGEVTEVSSEFNAAWAGANAIDDNLASEWSSRGSGDDAFITIHLGEATAIAGIEYLTRSMADGSAITTTFTVVLDGGERLGPFDASSPAVPIVHAAYAEAQELRFEVENSTGSNTGAIEVWIFAPQ